MAMAYNLTRLVYLEVDRAIEADFAEGVRRLTAGPWVGLNDLHAHYTSLYRSRVKQRPEWT